MMAAVEYVSVHTYQQQQQQQQQRYHTSAAIIHTCLQHSAALYAVTDGLKLLRTFDRTARVTDINVLLS